MTDSSILEHGYVQEPGSEAGSPFLIVDHPRDSEIGELCRIGRAAIPGLASDETVRRVARRNPDSLYGIFRMSAGAREPLGFYANLLLNDAGVQAVQDGELDRASPADEHMVEEGTRPAAIYSWAVVAQGLFEKTLPLLAHRMGDLYADLPILTSAATNAGRKTIKRRGFATAETGISTYDRSQDAYRSFRKA